MRSAETRGTTEGSTGVVGSGVLLHVPRRQETTDRQDKPARVKLQTPQVGIMGFGEICWEFEGVTSAMYPATYARNILVPLALAKLCNSKKLCVFVFLCDCKCEIG